MVIVSVSVAAKFALKQKGLGDLLLPLPAVGAAAVTAVVSLVSYLFIPPERMRFMALANYALLATTLGLLIMMTGIIHSPYLVLWMLLSIFAGLFGPPALGLIFVATNAGIVYEIFFSNLPLAFADLAVFFLTLEMPLAASYLIWHEKLNQDNTKNRALSALTQQLSQVANKSEIVINAIADSVVAIDSQGTIQLINPAAQQLLGWQKQDAVGLDYRSVIKLIGVNGQELPDTASPIRQVLTSGVPVVNNDLALTTNSGKKKLVSIVGSPLKNDKNLITGAIAVLRDVTDEKQEERQRAEFISTASHEMRTPVAAIEGYLGLALNPATAAIDDKARNFLLKAQEATQHLGTLFQDLLTVSRAEDNRLIPKQTVVDVVAFVREITEGLAAKAQAKGLFLYFKPGEATLAGTESVTATRTILPVYYVMADQGHFREVVSNLIDNAIKYTKQGSVAVDVAGDDNAVTVSVSDTGIGIPPEDTPHLFQKFYRIDNSATREVGGTGLGLYISRRLIEANGGRVWVTSTYGKGSTFFVQLPRVSHEKAAELAAAQPEKPREFTPAATNTTPTAAP